MRRHERSVGNTDISRLRSAHIGYFHIGISGDPSTFRLYFFTDIHVLNINMWKMQALCTYVLFHAVVLVSFVASATLNEDKNNVEQMRNKREISDFDESDTAKEKRLRDFLGKRSRDFLGKRSEDGLDFSDAAELEDMEKRHRDFLGKRSYEDEIDNEKRMRDFLGKRSYEVMDEDLEPFSGPFDGELYDSYDKRFSREFVGKRGYNTELVKRLRDFVGKRFSPEDLIMLRSRYFVRKPKYERELVGKRSYPMMQLDGLQEDKRMRDFLGKRSSRDFLGKRMRDFLG